MKPDGSLPRSQEPLVSVRSQVNPVHTVPTHFFNIHFNIIPPSIVGWDSLVGIAIRYVLDRPGVESRWGARFSASVHTGHRAHPASYAMGAGFLSRG